MAVSIRAASAAVRVIGPTWESVSVVEGGQIGTVPNVGLRPKTPQNPAGIRIEPAPSDPCAIGPRPAATAAAAPPLDPPAVAPCCHGLWVEPIRRLVVSPFQPCSGTFVFPSITAPAARSRSTTGASRSGTKSACRSEPKSCARRASR